MKPITLFIVICFILILFSLWKASERERDQRHVINLSQIESGCRFDLVSNGRYCKFDSMTETVYSRAY